jgi:hypothetical protein
MAKIKWPRRPVWRVTGIDAAFLRKASMSEDLDLSGSLSVAIDVQRRALPDWCHFSHAAAGQQPTRIQDEPARPQPRRFVPR